MNLILLSCDPKVDARFLIIESNEYPPILGGNIIYILIVLLEIGIVGITELVINILLNTIVGPIGVTTDYKNGKYKAITFDNIPVFMFTLNNKVNVPGLGIILIDIS